MFTSENDIAAEIAGAMAEANDFYVLTYEGAPGDGPNDYPCSQFIHAASRW